MTHIPPSAKHLERVLHTLDRAKPERKGDLKVPMQKMAEHFGRRGILLIVSDLYENPEAIMEAVKPLRFRGNDLIVFHVLDPAEIDFNFTDAVELPGSRNRRTDSRRADGPRGSSIDRWFRSTSRR